MDRPSSYGRAMATPCVRLSSWANWSILIPPAKSYTSYGQRLSFFERLKVECE